MTQQLKASPTTGSTLHNLKIIDTYALKHITKFDIVLNLLFLLGTILLFYFALRHSK